MGEGRRKGGGPYKSSLAIATTILQEGEQERERQGRNDTTPIPFCVLRLNLRILNAKRGAFLHRPFPRRIKSVQYERNLNEGRI